MCWKCAARPAGGDPECSATGSSSSGPARETRPRPYGAHTPRDGGGAPPARCISPPAALESSDAKAAAVQSIDRAGWLSCRPLEPAAVLGTDRSRRRTSGAGAPRRRTCCHTFGATGDHGVPVEQGPREHVQRIARRPSPQGTAATLRPGPRAQSRSFDEGRAHRDRIRRLTRDRRATGSTAPGPPAARGTACGRSASGASRWPPPPCPVSSAMSHTLLPSVSQTAT